MTGAEIAHALHGKQDGPSSWMCLCVAHEDKGPSLHITVKNGKVLFHCFAGCNYQAIQGALRSRGLLPEKADFRRKVIDYKPKPKYSPLPRSSRLITITMRVALSLRESPATHPHPESQNPSVRGISMSAANGL